MYSLHSIFLVVFLVQIEELWNGEYIRRRLYLEMEWPRWQTVYTYTIFLLLRDRSMTRWWPLITDQCYLTDGDCQKWFINIHPSLPIQLYIQLHEGAWCLPLHTNNGPRGPCHVPWWFVPLISCKTFGHRVVRRSKRWMGIFTRANFIRLDFGTASPWPC